MNPRNVVVITGYAPNPEKMGKAHIYKAGEGDKKSFLRSKLSVRRAYKDRDGEYKYDYLPFTAFGSNADFINNYVNGGDIITLHGELQISDNYEKDGETVYGTPFVLVDGVCIQHSAETRESSDGNGNAARKPAAPKASSSNNPLSKLRNRKSA
jgi:single-stranded DNA-binding protein